MTGETPEAAGIHFDRYATVAGAWWLNSRCHLLGAQEAQDYKTLVGMLTIAMRKAYGPPQVLQLQRAAKDVAAEVACDGAVRNIVLATNEMASGLVEALTDEAYGPARARQGDVLSRLLGAARVLDVAQRCAFGPEESRAEFAALVAALAKDLAPDLDDPTLPAKVEPTRNSVESGRQPPCNIAVHSVVLRASAKRSQAISPPSFTASNVRKSGTLALGNLGAIRAPRLSHRRESD